jgi:hypothetical protein
VWGHPPVDGDEEPPARGAVLMHLPGGHRTARIASSHASISANSCRHAAVRRARRPTANSVTAAASHHANGVLISLLQRCRSVSGSLMHEHGANGGNLREARRLLAARPCVILVAGVLRAKP